MADNPEQTFERLGPGGMVGSTRFDSIGLYPDFDDTFRAPLDTSVLMLSVQVNATFPEELIAEQEYWGLTAEVVLGGDQNLSGDIVSLRMSCGSHAYGEELTEAGLRFDALLEAVNAESMRLFLANQTDPLFSADVERVYELLAVIDDFGPVIEDLNTFDILNIEARLAAIQGGGSRFAGELSALSATYLEIVRKWYDPVYWIQEGSEPAREAMLVDTWDSFNFIVDDPALGFADIFIIGTTWVDTLDLQPADFALPYMITATVAVTEPPTAGNDTVSGSGRADRLDGLAGDDLIYGMGNADTVFGGAGNDTLSGGSGADSLDGGAGTRDIASYSNATTGLRADLQVMATNTGEAFGDVFSGIEGLYGTDSSDSLLGDTGANVINGGSGNDAYLDGRIGNDTIVGANGNDVLIGGAGADLLDGGTGTRDRAQYSDAPTGVRADLQVPTFNTGIAAGDIYLGIEDLFGSVQGDTLLGDTGANTIWGDAGYDAWLDGRLGNDTLYGGAGNDVLIGGWGADVLDGGAGTRDRAQYTDSSGIRADLQVSGFNTGQAAGDSYVGVEDLFGSFQSDTLLGDAGGNIIWGATGNDVIDGRLGNDTILCGAGNDTISGGAGADVFIFESAIGAANVDSLTGYSVADDIIHLENAVFAALTTTGTLASGAFAIGASATTTAHRIIYNATNGQLLYDADGNGGGTAIHFATLSAGLAMTAGEFLVI